MKEYTLNRDNLIISALIAINKKENRRIVDYQDIDNHTISLLEKAKQKDIKLVQTSISEESIKKYTNRHPAGYKTCYTMFPWIKIEELNEVLQNNLPEELIILLEDSEVINNIPTRTEKDLERLKHNEGVVSRVYEKLLEKEGQVETVKKMMIKKIK